MSAPARDGLPYLIETADVRTPGWAERVAGSLAASDANGLYLSLRSGGVPVDELVVRRRDGTDPARLLELSSHLVLITSTHRDRAPRRPDADTLTVVICTVGRATGLRRCLSSLTRQADADFRVLVVDNSRGASVEIESVISEFGTLKTVSVVREPRPGLSHARNRALDEVGTDLVAWIDDDEAADPSWVSCIRRTFREIPGLAAVSGRMLPGRLETEVDLLFEQFGGHNKGHAGGRQVFSSAALGDRRFYPLPPFAVGGNMAMRVAAVSHLPRFDVLLGAGAPCRAGEDTLYFAELLDAGLLLAFDPAVVTWHFHRPTMDELREQFDAYGVGLGGYFAALLVRRPRRLFALVRLTRRALRDQFDWRSLRNAGSTPELAGLRAGNRRAIVRGAARYLRLRAAPRLGVGRNSRQSDPVSTSSALR